MLPVSFESCFGLLHVPPSDAMSTAVVICPGLTIDELSGYTTLRLLADAFADAGFPTLRLHYAGTGDAPDPAKGPEYWLRWQQDIGAAIAWIGAHCGARRIILCGFRFGALLAATVAAARAEVAGLILLAPVLRGRSYMRQLSIESTPSRTGIDAGRFYLSAETVALISKVELRHIVLPPTCKTALFARPSTVLAHCAADWKTRGVELTVNDFAGLEPLLRPTFAMHEGSAEVAAIVSWAIHAIPDRSLADMLLPNCSAVVETEDWIETPQYFGPARDLFGVLCRPRQSGSEVVVLMVNASGDPHCAGGAVNTARHLARGGVASFRIDLAGLGDSGQANDQHVFETDRSGDCSAAIDALEALNYRQFAIFGLCSGAYHAFHGASADPRIGYAVLINLPFFVWTPGFPLNDLTFDVRKPAHFLQRLNTRAFWKIFLFKLVTGDLNLRVRLAWLERKFRRLPGFTQDVSLATRVAKQVKMLFLICEGDISGELLRREFGLHPPPGTRITLVPELNHAMTGSFMREVVARHIIAFLPAECSVQPPAKARSLAVADA